MKKFLLPEGGTYYKSNLHCHSTISDGGWTVEQIKEEYAKRGYSIVAYTDHDIMYDQTHLCDENFVALKGYEMATEVDCYWTADGHKPMENLEPNFRSWYYQKRAHFNLIAKQSEVWYTIQ